MRRLRSISLLARVSLISLVLFAALGLVLGKVLGDLIERRAHDNAVATAKAVADLGIRHYFNATGLRERPTADRVLLLDQQLLAADLRGAGIERVKVFNSEPRIVYSDDHGKIWEDARGAPNVERALRGQTVAHVSAGVDDSGKGHRTLSVYTPVRVGGSDRPNAVFELYIPYAPIAATIDHDRRVVYAGLAIGLLLLYGLLLPVVGRASRTLRQQLADNRHRATHDALTGLANRSQLATRADCLLAGGGSAALMLLDLDGFKEINDSLGHEHGDDVLREVAGRLASVMRPGDVLGRLGADEFAVLIPDVPSGEAALVVAERLRAALRAPLALPTLSLRLGVSVGVAIAPEHGTAFDDLMRSADLAMYRAKRELTEIELYRTGRDCALPDRITLSTDLPGAIERGDLVLHFQPQVDIRTGAPVAAEALVRWIHPERGLIPPDEFIPLAETTGAIADLTRYVLAGALTEQARWRAAGHDIAVAVNFAGPNVLDVDMPAAVRAAVERYQTPRGGLIVEISERTVMHGPRRLAGLLDQLREVGVQSSLDDFGTGQSSLAFVRSLPVDEIKIDRSFVFGMLENAADEAIAGSTIALGRALGLRVVAEGVEDGATRSALVAGGCDVAQGYLISKPLPADEFAAWLDQNGPAAGPRSTAPASQRV
jgi:diguanylate cyclase (GGDEF)-like protein